MPDGSRSLFTRLLTKKMATGAGEQNAAIALSRSLTRLDLVVIGVAQIIGAGIFVISGVGVRIAGPGILLSFLVAGLACTLAALCYAELASMMPKAGSAYTYAFAIFGELPAWIIGWDLVLEYGMGAATVAAGWSFYLQDLLQAYGLACRCGPPARPSAPRAVSSISPPRASSSFSLSSWSSAPA